MKPTTPLFIVLLTSLALVGCEKEKSTSQQIDQLKVETKQAARDINDYTFSQRAEFTTRMQAQLAAINADLNQLDAKIEKAGGTAKMESQEKLRVLREKTSQLGKQLDNAKDATESTWDSVKAGSKKGLTELQDGFTQARQWVSDKIAP